MKFFGQSKDEGIDKLLRAYVSRPSNPHQVCPDFDPDRANAYVESSLTGSSRLQYEAHLSDCAACRKNVVALSRLAGADTLSAVVPAREASRSTGLLGAKRLFAGLSQPQWAMAAVAVIVLAVSVPLFLSRNQAQEASRAIAKGDNSPIAATPASPSASPSASVENAPSLEAASRTRENRDEKAEVPAKSAPAAAKVMDAQTGVGAGADLAKKAEAADAVQPADEQRKAEGRLSEVSAQGGAAPGSQVAKNESDQGRQQEKDAAKQTTESKPVIRADEPSADKEKTRRAEEAAAPPPPSSSSEVARSRSGGRQPGKLSLRDSAPAEAVRDERRFSGRTFLFKDGAWTDKDFDPNKDLPVVTIIRDSNVYKELLGKRSGLRPIMERFASTERAIIVYKGTVYKLIPQ